MSAPSGASAIRVLVADDDPILLASIAGLLEDEASLELVATAHDAEEATALAIRHHPDVALLDVRMPGGGGPRAAREIAERVPEVAIVALSANGDRDSVFRMLAAGAVGYVVKGGEASEVIETIERAARREGLLSGEVTRHVVGKLARELRVEETVAARRSAIEARVREAIAGDSLKMLFQPIVTLPDRRLVGFEALARFAFEPRRGPDQWFADAEQVGLATELELEAISRALAVVPDLPEGTFLSVNASPSTVLSGALETALATAHPSRILLEVTEQAPIDDYTAFAAALAGLRAQGVRMAIDDVGSGFANLRHILRLAPDFIKLDRALIDDVDTARASRALVVAFVGFSREIGTTVLAEGLERPQQLTALVELGVTHGQGYLLGRPGPLDVEQSPPHPRPRPDVRPRHWPSREPVSLKL